MLWQANHNILEHVNILTCTQLTKSNRGVQFYWWNIPLVKKCLSWEGISGCSFLVPKSAILLQIVGSLPVRYAPQGGEGYKAFLTQSQFCLKNYTICLHTDTGKRPTSKASFSDVKCVSKRTQSIRIQWFNSHSWCAEVSKYVHVIMFKK
jgi:hypothetical protein